MYLGGISFACLYGYHVIYLNKGGIGDGCPVLIESAGKSFHK